MIVSRSVRTRKTISPPLGARGWARLVQECQRDGIEPRLFCQGRGLFLKTFQWWRWALASGRRRIPARNESSPTSPSRVGEVLPPVLGFIEVVPPRRPTVVGSISPRAGSDGRPGRSGVKIVIRPEREITIRVDREFDPDSLRQVVRILEEVTGC